MDKLTRFLTKKSRNVQAAGLTIQNTQLHHQQQTEDEKQHQRTEDEQQKNQQIEDKQQPQQTEDKQQHQRTEDKQQHQHGEAANAFIEENIHHHFSSQVTHHHSPHTSPHHFSPHLLPQHPSTPPFTNLLESPGNKKRKLFSRLNQRDNNNNNNFNNNNNDNNFNNNNNNFNEKNNNYNDNNNNFNDNNNNNFNDNSKNNNFNKKDNNFNNDKTNKSNKSIHHGGIQDHYHHSLETHSSQTEEETPFFHNSLLSIHPSTHPSTHTCTHIAHKQILHPHNKLILSNDNNDDDGEEDEDGGDGDGNDPAPGENIRVTKSINKETHEQHEDQCTKSDIDNNINKDEHNNKPPHSHIADNSTKSNHNHLFNFHNNNSNHNTNNNKNTDLGSFNNTSINNTTQVSKINRSQSGNKCFGVHGESCHGNSSSSKTGCRCSKRYSYYTSWGSYSNSCVNHKCSNNSCGNHGNCHVNHSNSCNISSYAAQSCHRTSQGGHCIGADDYSCDKNNNNNNIDAHSSLVNSGGKGLVLGRKSPMVTSSTEHLYRSVIGQIFLMCDSEMKRCVLLQSINSMDTIFKIVCEAFPRKISMWQLSSSTPFYQLYLLDSQLSLFYLLEDYRDVKNLSVIKIFPAQESHPQQDINDQQIQQPQITYQRQQQELDDFNQQQQQQHTTPTESPKLTSNSPKGHKTNTLKQNKKQKQQYQLNNNNNSSARVANMGCFGQMTSYRTIFSKKLHKSPLKSLTSHTKYDLKHQKFDPEVEGSIPSKKQKSLHKLSLKPQSPNSRSSKFTSSSSSSSSFDRCNNYYSLERNRNSRCKHPHTTTILKPQRSLSANSSPSVSINNNLNKNNKTCNKCNKNYDVYNNNNNEIKNNKLESNDASTHTMKKTKYCCRKHCSCYNTQHNYSHNTPQHHNRRSCSYHYHHPPQDHYHYPLHDHYHHQTSSSESLPLDLVNTNYNICNNNISINNENVESNNNISSINSNSNNIDNNKNKNNNANDQNNKNSKSEAEERVKELEKQLACLTEWVQTTIQTDQKIQHFQDNFMQHKHIKTDNTEDDVDDVDNNTLKNENKEKKTDTKRKSDIDTLTKKGDKKSSRDTKAETDTQKKPDRETSKERFGMVVGELRHQCEELRVAHQVQMNELISMVSTVRRAIKKTTDSNNAYEELPVSWGTPPSVRIRPLSSHSTLYQAANSYHNNSSLLKNPKNSLHSNSHGNHYSIYAYNSIQEGTHCGDSCYCGSSHHYGGIGEEYNHHHQQGHQTAQQHKAQINPNDYYLCGTQQQNNNNNNINCNNNNNNHNVRRNKSCNRDLSPEDSPDVVKSNRGSEDIKSHRNIATYSKIKKQKNEENKDKDRNNKKNDKKINGTEESKADKIWVPM